ncbi:SDR family oxidoreductase [Marinicella sp. S1101]|uniref:SDR family oxidoreductase n=1 Tax=Marinicella marina TaxID=2996016 RepID=UPI002260E106|nr:SDR family oxidoreductase [Marinicella marina]MCX7554203.1 SDR family oxidoreductase [Marinicella marina]MDJ1141104.1 SDR family oxidoreductase [Marinicella marina]
MTNSIQWDQTVVVLTGAYGGLGRALATSLSERGVELILVGRNLEKLKSLASELPSQTHFMSGDVSDPFTLDAINQLANGSDRPIRMLINNAAVSHVSYLENCDDQAIIDTVNVNLIAPMILSKKLLAWLKAGNRAQIINIGSSFGGIGFPGFNTYCASKFGLRGFTQALNRELNGTSTTAQYLSPRAMSTNINSNEVNALNSQLGNAVDKPTKIAQSIIDSIEKKHSEKFYGWPEKFFVKINALMPSLVTKGINKDQKTIQHHLNNEVKS